MARLSQAISEGDGISIVPLLQGDVAELAALAEEAGADAVAVSPRDVVAARAATSLPIVADSVRDRRELDSIVETGVDGCLLVYDPDSGQGERIEELYPAVDLAGTDVAVEVRDTDELAEVLERFDPEILVAASPNRGDEDELEHVLDLLADTPAGKLVIARPRQAIDRGQVVALERAGVDGILVGGDFLRHSPDFASTLAELSGR